MVNTEKFASRLNKIIKFYDLSAASFADKIEVGRSSISHILAGRNKPSLDFVMKVVKTFPEVELYWLLNGKGTFPKEDGDKILPPSEEKRQRSETEKLPKDPPSKMPIIDLEQQRRTGSSKAIKKIVIFYEDGTFDAFEN